MLAELQQFDGILISIKKNADSFNNSLFATDDGHSALGLLTNLQYCEAEFKVLKDLAAESKRNQGLGLVKRQNDIIIRGQIKATQDGIQAAQTVSGNQHQGLLDQIQQSTTTLKRKFEESREAVTSNTEVIRRDISQANSGVLKVNQVVQTSIEQSAKRQRGLARQHADGTIQLLERMDRMQAILSNYIGAKPRVGTVTPVNVTTTENLDVIVMPLMLMKSNLPEAISMLESGGQAFLSKEDAEFLQSEVNELLAAAHGASSVALRRPQSSGEVGESAFLESYEPCTQPHLTKELPRKAAWKQFAHWTFVGMLSIGIRKESGTLSSAMSASVTFMPKPELSKLGVSIVWTKEMRAAINPRISRCIRTFRILASYKHPAICAAKSNNVLELQRMLSAKEISPWDRNTESHNLVFMAARHGAYDVTRLLLEKGATAHDSHWGEHNALWDVWLSYAEIASGSRLPGEHMYNAPDDLEFWINLSDLVIRYGASAEECLNLHDKYGNLLFIPSTYPSIPFPALETLCKYLIRIGSDIEARNKKSQTPLLHAAYSFREGSINWLPILRANGADLTAQDAGGRGGFHQMFLGYVELMEEGIITDFFYAYENFEAKANILLDAGCNPFKHDLEGHIPSCYAWNNEILGLWQSILGKWVAREGVSEQCTCPFGGLYESVDMREQYRDSEGESSEGSGLSEREEEELSETEETERCSQGEDLEHNEVIWEDDDGNKEPGNSEGTRGGSGQSLGSGWGVEGDEKLEDQESLEEEAELGDNESEQDEEKEKMGKLT